MALLQCIFIIGLQAAICLQNTLEANLLPASDSKILNPTTTNTSEIHLQAKERLERIKWENIAFMGFQVWYFVMAIDAVRSQKLTYFNILVLTLLVDCVSKHC